MKNLFALFLALGFFAAGVSAQTFPYVFVFLNSKSDKKELPKEEVEELMKGHLANIERLAREGKLLAAGPFEGGGGIFIFNSSSVEEVREWLSTDPGIQAERWRVETLPYDPRIGSVCTVDESAEMVTYQFIRFTSVITKFSVHHAAESFKKHEDFVKQLAKTGNVITEGFFANQDGGILIMKGDVESQLIDTDPAVEDGLLVTEYKRLWIAKGSFCER
jgi:uncharacterized protein YciI